MSLTYMNDRTADATHEIERVKVPALDNILGHAFPVLDHGFVRVIDYMGDDSAICQAARVSYGKGTKSTNDDRGLIRYLMRHWHSTPFEMCEVKIHVKLPVFVARQWIRHRTANVNEYSARYSILDKEFYIPDPSQMQKQSLTNNQGRDGQLERELAVDMAIDMRRLADDAYGEYVDFLKDGLSRELARINLPANIYTQWYWKVDLHNLLHFLRLRADPHAQWEIRQYANLICEMVAEWVPHAWEAFNDYRLEAKTFSRMEMDVLRGAMKHAEIETPEGMSLREWREFIEKIG